MKIKATDLRVGNYIRLDEDDSIAKTIGVLTAPDGVNVYFESNKEETYIELDKFSPIKITESILDNCGFLLGGWLRDFVKGHHCYAAKEGLKGRFSKTNHIFYFEKTEIKYVHELQNLYHSITKNELEINL